MLNRDALFKIICCISLLAWLGNTSAWAQDASSAKGGFLQWGGSGYDHERSKGSTRFTARIGKDEQNLGKAIIEIRVDTQETWKDLAELSLSSEDGKTSVTSIRRWKSQRHLTAPWNCVFLADDISKLPDDGLIIAWNSNRKKILSEKVDFRPIKALILAFSESEAK